MHVKKGNSILPVLPTNMVREEKIVTDPQGSYTGRPKDREEIPVQDADDL